MVVLSLVFLKPKLWEIFRLRQSYSTNEKKISQLTKKITVLEGLDQNDLVSKSEPILQILPSLKDVPTVFSKLKGLGSETGATISVVKVEPGELEIATASAKEILSLPFSVIVIADVDKLKSFLTKIESSRPLMIIENLEVSGKENNLLEAEIKFNTYYLPLPESLGPIETAVTFLTSQEQETYQLAVSRFAAGEEGAILPEGGFSLTPASTAKENPFVF